MKQWNMTECNKVSNDLNALQDFARRIQNYIRKKDAQGCEDNYIYQNLESIIAIADDANEHVYLM